MNAPLLIAQISDCHLPADPRQTYRGVNARGKLENLVEHLSSMAPDLVLASGDISEDGSDDSYRFFRQSLKPLGAPVLALPGNHDRADRLARYFPGSPVNAVAKTAHGSWQIIRLDTCVPGQHWGQLDGEALEELDRCLRNSRPTPCLIAMHHQPLQTGSPWIDRYGLRQAQDFLEVLDRYPQVRAVVWGHIHQSFESDRNGVAMLGGPSSVINSMPGVQKFTPDTAGPACRWLKLMDDASIETGIARPDG